MFGAGIPELSILYFLVVILASLYLTELWRHVWRLLARRTRPEQFTIALICPMSVEFTAVKAILDQEFDRLVLPLTYDTNAYTYGRIACHNVVIVCLPGTGKIKASEAAAQLRNDFANLRLALLVGVAGGLPSFRQDIRLRDVVIGTKIVVHDHGKWENQTFRPSEFSVRDSSLVKCSVAKFESKHSIQSLDLDEASNELLNRKPALRSRYSLPIDAIDELYQTTYRHVEKGAGSCIKCSKKRLQLRNNRPSSQSQIHFGTIGSVDAVFKSSEKSYLLAQQKMLCVEMEAAGIADKLPCIVIRGICDYADSHKNKIFQPNAAMLAAIVAKDLLLSIPPRVNSF